MARYPKAKWRPLGRQTEPRLTKKNKIVMHTMVGTLWGTDHYFRDPNGPGYSGTESHFGTDPDEVLQWQETSHQADAQLDGNDDCISIETADHGGPYRPWSGSNVPAWTPAHLEVNAQLVAWLCKTHDIPCELIDDTRDSTRGVGYHRQGIDPYRERGERYSTAFGKECPGDRRVAQMPQLIERANEILRGDDMPTAKEIVQTWENSDAGNLPDGRSINNRLAGLYGARFSYWGSVKTSAVLRNQARDHIILTEIKRAVGAQDVDEAALAAELLPLLAPLIVDELKDIMPATQEQIEQAQERVLRRVLGSLDDTDNEAAE